MITFLHLVIRQFHFLKQHNKIRFILSNQLFIFILAPTEQVSFWLGQVGAQAVGDRRLFRVEVPLSKVPNPPNVQGACLGQSTRCLSPKQFYLCVNMLTLTDRALKCLLKSSSFHVLMNQWMNRWMNHTRFLYILVHFKYTMPVKRPASILRLKKTHKET